MLYERGGKKGGVGMWRRGRKGTDRYTDIHSKRQTDRHTQTCRRTDRYADRQIYRQTDRETNEISGVGRWYLWH